MARYNKSDIMSTAHKMHKVTGESFSACLKRSWMLAKLRYAMKQTIVQFFYIKKSTGELRQAFGTLMPGRIAPTHSTKAWGWDTICYYDTEVNDYRCFKAYNLVKIAA